MTTAMMKEIQIRKVWAFNIFQEFELISKLIVNYPFVSVDTEFPGTIFRQNPKKIVPQYFLFKANVDHLKLIQVGLTLSDAAGNLPDLGTDKQFVWEFNFCDFYPQRDAHAPDSIKLLKDQGIDFDQNSALGAHTSVFAHLMIRSGLIFNKSVTWVTFHGSYDFGYLVKIITRSYLPIRAENFLHIVKAIFGDIYDVKHMVRFCNGLYGGLENVATLLAVDRAVGKAHQAASDSLLTWKAFQKIRDMYFLNDAHVVKGKCAGVLYGFEIQKVARSLVNSS